MGKSLKTLGLALSAALLAADLACAHLLAQPGSAHPNWTDSVRLVAQALGTSRRVLKPYEAYSWLSYGHYQILRFTFSVPGMARRAASRLSIGMGDSTRLLPMGKHFLTPQRSYELLTKEEYLNGNDEAWAKLRKELQEMPDLLIPLPVISFTQKLEEQIREMQHRKSIEGFDKPLPAADRPQEPRQAAPSEPKSRPGEKQTA